MSILTRPRPPRADDPSDAEALEALIEEARRRARRRRRGYAACALVAAAAALLVYFGFNHGGGATQAQDGAGPGPLPQGTDVFAQVRGWIAYTDWGEGNDEKGVGIFAVDPTRPEGDLSDRIQLYDHAAKPLGWSDDGTKLLIRGSSEAEAALFLLNADGTETVLQEGEHPGHVISASLSPDGSQVVYALFGPGYESGDFRDSGIYVVETDGGRPHPLKKFGRSQWYADGPDPSETTLWQPTFSPDGRKIAYVDGMGDWGNGLRVMNADGSHVRVLLDSDGKLSDGIGSHSLAWSPDGSRLAFNGPGGIWVIGADGSGLRKLIPGGGNPSWSPDGSSIAYQSYDGSGGFGPLRIADADGGNVQEFAYGNPGPWNPLQPASD
jgi:hypothetical protein